MIPYILDFFAVAYRSVSGMTCKGDGLMCGKGVQDDVEIVPYGRSGQRQQVPKSSSLNPSGLIVIYT